MCSLAHFSIARRWRASFSTVGNPLGLIKFRLIFVRFSPRIPRFFPRYFLSEGRNMPDITNAVRMGTRNFISYPYEYFICSGPQVHLKYIN
jgi:hypothetical protein